MSPRPLLSLGFFALGLGVLAYLWMADDATSGQKTPMEKAVETAVAEAPAEAPTSVVESPPPEPTAVPSLEPVAARRAELDRKRARIRERLEQRRVDDARPAARPEADAEPPTLDKQYIRESVRELIPVIRECYENALQDDDALGGKLVMKFEILGDEDVGGVVDHVEVDPEHSTIPDADMRECMRESMYTLELPAPSAGGSVMVTYPFVFSPE